MPVTIRIVYDNNKYDPALKTAWGFSCLIKGYEKTILFDTGGNGGLLLSNMEKLGIGPADVDVVVLSHIHGDHTGGLGEFLARNHNVVVFLPESFPKRFKEEVRGTGAQVVPVGSPRTICEGVYSVGELGGRIKEQSLCLDTREGLVVITGCAHPGIVSIVEKAKDLSERPVHLVMGGFHLSGASAAEVRSVIVGLGKLGARNLAPCHCSGDRTRRMMKEAFGDRYLASGVGAQFIFHRNYDKEEEK